MKAPGTAAVAITIPSVPQDGSATRSGKIAKTAQRVEEPMTRPLRHEAIDERRSAADRTEDIVATIAREKGIDLMLAAEVFMHRCDRLHVEWRVRPRMVRRHGATNINLAEVIVGFKQGNADRLDENGSIAALITNRIVFDHRQAMKRGGAARCGGGDHRGIEAAR